MTLKSLLQTLLGAFPIQGTPPTQIDVTHGSEATGSKSPISRLQGRSDWRDGLSAHKQIMPGDAIEPIETDGGGADMVPPWDRPGARYQSPLTCDPWPPNDDPYAVPCEMVPDPALAGLDKLAARGLTRPMDSVKSVTDLLQLIQRQEAAEKLAIRLGYTWNGTMWRNRSADGF